MLLYYNNKKLLKKYMCSETNAPQGHFLQGTLGAEKTLKNLAAAFVGESQARNRYTIYAKIAKDEGFEQISAIFLETADQEREHAKWLLRMINDIEEKEGMKQEEIVVEAGVPTVTGDTATNLKAAIAGENHEFSKMYPDFAGDATEDGLPEVASRLRFIAKAEAHHEERYKKLLKEVEAGSVFKKTKEVNWVCRNCGYEHKDCMEAPRTCPACSYPQSFFQVKNEIY